MESKCVQVFDQTVQMYSLRSKLNMATVLTWEETFCELFEANTFSKRGDDGGVMLHRRCYLVNTQLSSYKHKQNPVERLALRSFKQLVKNEPPVNPVT